MNPTPIVFTDDLLQSNLRAIKILPHGLLQNHQTSLFKINP